MLADNENRRAVAKLIARDAMRGDDGDPFGELTDYHQSFFRGERINVQIPVVDPAETRRCLMFLIDQLPALVADMDRVPDRHSKSMIAQGKLRVWSQAFRRGMKGKGRT